MPSRARPLGRALLASLAAALVARGGPIGAQASPARRVVAPTAAPTARLAALVDSAWSAYERGDRQTAATRAESALAMAPASQPRARFALGVLAGRARVDLGDARQALDHLERTLALNVPRRGANAWAMAYLGRARYALGDTTGARTALEAVAGLVPTPRIAATVAADWRLFGFDSTYARWTVLETPHLRLHLSPAAPILDRLAFAATREDAAVRIGTALGAPDAALTPKRIDVFVWDSEREAQAAGLERVHFARPAVGLTHLTWDQTVGHEIAHVVAYRAVRPQVASPLVTEGVAVWFDGSGADRVEEASTALVGRGLARVDLRALWADWSTLPITVAYPVAGAVIEMLTRTGDRAQLRALLERQTLADAQRIYGATFDARLDALEQRLAERAATLAAPTPVGGREPVGAARP